MSELYVARPKRRLALRIPMEATREKPTLLLPLYLTDRSELDELIRAQLEKLGVTKESDVQGIIEKTETDYELRCKVDDARKELRRLMALRGEGKSLMQVGNRKWKEAFYRPIK